MQLKIGQYLYLQFEAVEGETEEEYRSRVADTVGDTVLIEVPLGMKTGKSRSVQPGETLSIYTLEDGVRYYFSSDVISVQIDPIALVAIRMPDPNKVYRRNHLRVSAKLEVALEHNRRKYTAITRDVSGGGLSFVTDGDIAIGTHESLSGWLLIQYRKGSVEHVPFKAEVVRVHPSQGNKQQLVVCRFTYILSHEQEKIIRFCFERQLELRKK